jgi:hypothetical protein
MRIRGARVLGLLLLLSALTGCENRDGTVVPAADGDVAVPSYEAPPQAPDLCVPLAGSRHVSTIPTAVGTLMLEPADEHARRELAGAVTELEAVLAYVWREPGSRDLRPGMQELIAALYSATVNPVDDQLATRIGERLDAVAEQVQPMCEFPL